MLPRTLLLPAAALALGLFTLPACDKEKSGAEKLAEQLASANSASAQLKVDAAPDPAELQYKERKAALEKTIADRLMVEGQLMRHEKVAGPGSLKPFFSDGSEGEKLARDLETKRAKDGDDGYNIKKGPKIANVNMKGTMDEAAVVYIEETEKKGLSACLQYEQTWKLAGSKWVLASQKAVQKVDCE